MSFSIKSINGIARRTAVIFVALVIVDCAPEPTSPAATSLAGIWTANAHLFALSDIKMTLVQEPEGIVSGGWSAKGDGGTGGCLAGVPCDASGHLIGQNTLGQISLELLGAAKFEGALVEPERMRGALILGAGFDTITFIRTGR